jgi:flagellar motor switch/type III secretory pathway protein FliN
LIRQRIAAVAPAATATPVASTDSRREITDVKTPLSAEIARNSRELADLRRKGDRDLFEFDLRKPKTNEMTRIADIQLQLRKTDPQKAKYDILIQVDNIKLEKNDRTVNEPVQFLVGRDKWRYELVVNVVEANRVRGYLSAPKDKLLVADRPFSGPPVASTDSRREITDVKTPLSAEIARNSRELADLRRKGDRDFFEFDLRKPKKMR